MMTGQVCMSVERVYVEEPVARRVHAEARRARCRAPRRTERPEAEIDLGPFTSPRQVEIVERHVADARRARAPRL
jgi:acyl-CoA reductase-like NAD-dependent aldehyde dehydrogenase